MPRQPPRRSLRSMHERRIRVLRLEAQRKDLMQRIATLRRRLVPIVTELQALRFAIRAETEQFRATTADREADDVQVWILRQKGFKA